MNDILFIQPSTWFVTPENDLLEYYTKVYSALSDEGFHIPSRHYMEIPLWVAVLAGKLSNHNLNFMVAVDMATVLAKVRMWRDNDLSPSNKYILMSALDVNKHIIYRLAKLFKDIVFLVGGYVDPTYFSPLENVLWMDSIAEVGQVMSIDLDAPPDYSFFEGQKTIPRLTLSTGCLHRCKFCTVEQTLEILDAENISKQVESFMGLEFSLVYLNDKTFGQAKNWRLLRAAWSAIKDYNPYFQGFVVQTTVPMARKYAKTWYEDYHVKAIEVGIEIPDDEFLTNMNKPYRLKQLLELEIPEGLLFIPNLIFGYPQDDYVATEKWYYSNQKDIAFVNPYVLSLYNNAKGGEFIESDGLDEDSNENVVERSWLSPIERKLTKAVMGRILGQVLRNLRL
jgi:hypothetical protein